MSVRSEVQAGDDAIGADDPRPGEGQQPQGNAFGLSDEEAAQFAEMERNSQPGAEAAAADAGDAGTASADGAPDAGGLTSRDVNADAQRAAEAGTQPQQPGQDPAAAKQPGADDDDDDSDPTEGGRHPQRVNYHKFARARERAQKATAELATERETRVRMEERYKMLADAIRADTAVQAPAGQQGTQPQQGGDELGPMPDPEKDIFAWATWQAKRADKLESQLQQTQTGFTQHNEETQLRTTYAADIQNFSGQQKDFAQAYEFMMATRVAELAAQYYGVDLYEQGSQLQSAQLDRIAKVIENEERELAKIAIGNQQSPAKQIYIMAKARGYRPAAAPAAGQTNGQPAANGAARPSNGAAQNGQPTTPVSAAVAAAKRGVETNRSLSEGGGAPSGELTREQVMAMDNDKFAQFMETASREQMLNILGA